MVNVTDNKSADKYEVKKKRKKGEKRKKRKNNLEKTQEKTFFFLHPPGKAEILLNQLNQFPSRRHLFHNLYLRSTKAKFQDEKFFQH